MHVLAVGVLEMTIILERDSDIQIFLMERFFPIEVELTWMGLEMELWKDSCCSRREASAKLGDQERRHLTCEQIVVLKHCLFYL